MTKDLWFRVQGNYAHFGGVSFGPERTTMLVPSASAAIGQVRSIFGKASIEWLPQELRLFRKPERVLMTVNELKSFATGHQVERTQRQRTMLRGCDYALRMRYRMSPRHMRPNYDYPEKVEEMLATRLKKQQSYRSVYLGVSQAGGVIEWVPDSTTLPNCVDHTEDFGWVFYATDHHVDDMSYLAPLSMKEGIVKYPSWDDVRKYGRPYCYKQVL